MLLTRLHKNIHLARVVKKLCLAIVFITIYSCSSNENSVSNLPGLDFGVSVYHEGFLFSDTQNPSLSKTLIINFNEWAIQNDAHAELILVDHEGTTIGTDESRVDLYVNETRTVDGRILINSQTTLEDSLTLKLKFCPSTEFHQLSGFIQMNSGTVERVNNIETLGQQENIFQWRASQQVVMNPLKKGVIWFFVLLFILLVIWFLILRNQVYPKMGAGRLTIQNPYYKSIKIKGKREVKLTSKSSKQRTLSRIFAGEKFAEKNQIWQEDLIFKPARKNQLRVKLPAGYSIEPYASTITRGASYTITSNQLEVKFSYL